MRILLVIAIFLGCIIVTYFYQTSAPLMIAAMWIVGTLTALTIIHRKPATRNPVGIAAIVSCSILSTFDTFVGSPLVNVAWWGIYITIIYMVLSEIEMKKSTSS